MLRFPKCRAAFIALVMAPGLLSGCASPYAKGDDCATEGYYAMSAADLRLQGKTKDFVLTVIEMTVKDHNELLIARRGVDEGFKEPIENLSHGLPASIYRYRDRVAAECRKR